MGQFNLALQGKNVRLALASTFASSTSSVPLGIFDAQNNPVTLLPTERLVIDFLTGNISSGSADVLAAAGGASTTASSTLIASFNTAVGLEIDTKEGIAVPVGIVPSILASVSTAVVKVSGAGRIMEGTTQGVRPDWRELQTAKGNY